MVVMIVDQSSICSFAFSICILSSNWFHSFKTNDKSIWLPKLYKNCTLDASLSFYCHISVGCPFWGISNQFWMGGN